MLRVSLSYAITQMVMQPHASSNGTIISDLDICPPFEDELSIDEGQQTVTMHPISAIDRFDWSQSLQGLILSSFYWGYIVTHIPGGLLSQKIGGKNTCLIGVLIATICTLVSPLAIQMGTAFPLLFPAICNNFMPNIHNVETIIISRRFNSFNRSTCDSWSRWRVCVSLMQYSIGGMDAAEGTQHCCVGRLLGWHDRFGDWLIMFGPFDREIRMDVSFLRIRRSFGHLVYCFRE